MRIYVASSWRNEIFPTIVKLLRDNGHEVYDFREPETAFSWDQIDPNWRNWTVEEYRRALQTTKAASGYYSDRNAILHAEACVLVLPAGRSAGWELGFAHMAGKVTAVYVEKLDSPDLMFYESAIVSNHNELLHFLNLMEKM